MEDLTLSGNQLFWIIIVAMGGFVVGWCVTFIVIKDRSETMRELLLNDNLIRVLTVMFVVIATTLLAVIGKLNEAVSAIFAGIVGYVLGTTSYKRGGGGGTPE